MKYALDCEMVGSGNRSILAKVSIVDENGRVVLDTFVKPTATVTDYRTEIHGITANDLARGEDFSRVQDKVVSILGSNTLIGHSLKFDLEALSVTCPQKHIRDLAKYPLFVVSGCHPVSLKQLAASYLGRSIQRGTHDSVEDAKAAMDIYLKFAHEWERSIQ